MLEKLVELEERLAQVRSLLEEQFPYDAENPVILTNRLRSVFKRLEAIESSIGENTQVKHQFAEAFANSSDVLLGDVSHAVDLLQNSEVHKSVSRTKDLNKRFCELVTKTNNNNNYRGSQDNLLTTRTQLNVALLNSAAITGSAIDNSLKQSENEKENNNSNVQNEQEHEDEDTTIEIKAALDKMNQDKMDGQIEISSSAFLALPESVRGRAKLYQVQNALNTIQSHFNIEKEAAKNKKTKRHVKVFKAEPISLKKLDTMGAKVTGHTGANVIQTLRSLGFISVGKAGVTLR
mmetsp:Transcript_28409/g.34689  ORF Transcript_28409/g.34689 Transcript_28409/m.34689 type:complete len:292 (-) Transcript_28409:1460-2335(-)